MKITNNKHQITNKSQIPITNDQNPNPGKPEPKKINHENPKCRKSDEKIFPDYLKRTSVLDFVGAASSRELKRSWLEAAPTRVFFINLDLPDKRIFFVSSSSYTGWARDKPFDPGHTVAGLSCFEF